MLDPPETATGIAKAAKELGLDPIVSYLVMVGGFVVSVLAWVIGERGGKKRVDKEIPDIAAALIRHEEHKSIALIAAKMTEAVVLLGDAVKILNEMERGITKMDEGIKHSHLQMESMFNDLQFEHPPRRPRRGHDQG